MSRIPHRYILCLSLLVILLAVSCSDNDSPIGPLKNDPRGTIWLLTDWQGTLGLTDLRELDVTVEFLDSAMAGYSGCNWYAAKCQLGTLGEISVGDIYNTNRGCRTPNGIIQSELYYALRYATRVIRDGDRLFIPFTGPDNRGTMIFKAVDSTSHWPGYNLVDHLYD